MVRLWPLTILVAAASLATALAFGAADSRLVAGCAASPRAALRCAGSIDVSDLGLTMADLERDLPPSVGGGSSLVTSGVESSSGLAPRRDEGIAWKETYDLMECTLTIPGLRGQPTQAMLLEMSETTATVTVFGRIIWTCILRGDVDPTSAVSSVRMDGMQPVIELSVHKASPEPRWNGFLDSIGVDSILQ
ncbi:hypothetical protein T492DRAFT_912459 [Pavlovales sp. CCMP2436]|nr:hypothetical protein T492DRAFT_912459 [Pavlovales sp. CCMP2436]|mmetsp:Transcript_11232/g.28371  ORF Transcript_11232/g.28371 Transcript_11232/m.28371 type:complete len:191 (+) Transcript_11232:111-683(+)